MSAPRVRSAAEISARPFTIATDLDLGDRAQGFAADTDADIRIFEAPVPEALSSHPPGVAFDISEGRLLLRVPDGTRILVENGDSVAYQRGPRSTDKDVALFVLGSALGAICYQRGLIPLHASAVLHGGRIVGFSGHSGTGKSTLAAMLAQRGLPLFTDDLLIFDPRTATTYAGPKDLKLWDDAVEALGLDVTERVRSDASLDKFFVRAPSLGEQTSGALAALYILKRNHGDAAEDHRIERLAGGDALQALLENIYRPQYSERLMGRAALFRSVKALLEAVPVARFYRHAQDGSRTASAAFMAREIGRRFPGDG